MKIGVLMCDTTYCGKKHYRTFRSISNTKEVANPKGKITCDKLTCPGLSLEVQDAGKFFAEPYNNK